MSDFEIVYKGDSTRNGFDMAVIGESMMGFNDLLKDFYKACGIDGELHIRTTSVQQGSVIITGQLIAEVTERIIENPELFMESVKQVDLALWRQIDNFMSAIGSADKSINDFFAERSFTSSVVSGIVASLPGIVLALWLDKKSKGEVSTRVTKLDQKIENLAKRKRFNRALKPLQDSGYDSITYVSKINNKVKQAVVRDSDLQKILPEDDKILPEYQNGMRFSGTGTVKSLSLARGERVGIAFHHDARFKNRTYPSFPDDGHTSTSYRNLYGEDVVGEFEVVRKSDFKVPEFKILSLQKLQTELLSEDVE